MPVRIPLVLTRPLGTSRVPFRNSIRPFSSANTTYVEKNPDPKRDAMQDREKLNPTADEYSQSASDDSTAQNESAAFNRISDPQEAKEEAGKGNDVNPLDASPANPDISQPTTEKDGGAKKKISEGGGGRQAKDEGKGNESI